MMKQKKSAQSTLQGYFNCWNNLPRFLKLLREHAHRNQMHDYLPRQMVCLQNISRAVPNAYDGSQWTTQRKNFHQRCDKVKLKTTHNCFVSAVGIKPVDRLVKDLEYQDTCEKPQLFFEQTSMDKWFWFCHQDVAAGWLTELRLRLDNSSK